MAKKMFIGTENLSRQAKKGYIGVNNQACKIKKGYIGVDGVAQQFYANMPEWIVKEGVINAEYLSFDNGLEIKTSTGGDVGSSKSKSVTTTATQALDLSNAKCIRVKGQVKAFASCHGSASTDVTAYLTTSTGEHKLATDTARASGGIDTDTTNFDIIIETTFTDNEIIKIKNSMYFSISSDVAYKGNGSTTVTITDIIPLEEVPMA